MIERLKDWAFIALILFLVLVLMALAGGITRQLIQPQLDRIEGQIKGQNEQIRQIKSTVDTTIPAQFERFRREIKDQLEQKTKQIKESRLRRRSGITRWASLPSRGIESGSWLLARVSTFGAGSDNQRVAYLPATTEELNSRGLFYVASRDRALAKRHIEIEFGPKSTVAVVADYGPAVWTGRDLDLSVPLAHFLGVRTDQVVRWRVRTED